MESRRTLEAGNTAQQAMPTLLVVQADRVLGVVLQGLFEKCGCRVVIVRTGAEAAIEIGRQQFHLITVDDTLFGTDTCGFLRLVRASPQYESVPLVVTSTHDPSVGISAMLASGANLFIRLPLTKAQARETLEQLGVIGMGSY
jgi:CheY-like chemotaxis protein